MSGIPVDRAKCRCVRFGLATVNKQTGKLRYDWDAIKKAWIYWPNANLTEFCAHFDLIYRVVRNSPAGFSVAEKKAVLDDANTRYRGMVLADAAIASFGDIEGDAKKLTVILNDLRQNTALAAKFAKSKMAKLGQDGKLFPNITVPSKEVKTLMDITHKCSETLMNVFSLADMNRDDTEEQPVRKMRPMLMESNKLKLAGGHDAEQKTA